MLKFCAGIFSNICRKTLKNKYTSSTPFPSKARCYKGSKNTVSESNKILKQNMFSFFIKKEFLVDHLEGFVDIHNHILPGIDDGAKNVDESLELIKGFGEFGVTDFICTPHIMENYYPNTPETINTSLAILQNWLKINNFENVKIRAAAEHMIDSGFEKKIADNHVMPLDKKYLLIEMSYLQPSINFDASLKLINERGYFPILAHPERYVFLHNKIEKYIGYKKMGVLFQLNILSLSDYYGKEVQKTAIGLIDDGLVDFLSSDVHNKEQLKTIKSITLNRKMAYLLPILIDKTINNFFF